MQDDHPQARPKFTLSQTDMDTIAYFLPEIPQRRERLEALLGRCWVKSTDHDFKITCAVCLDETDGTGTIVWRGDPFCFLPCGHVVCDQCSIDAVADHELELDGQPAHIVISRIETLMAGLACKVCKTYEGKGKGKGESDGWTAGKNEGDGCESES